MVPCIRKWFPTLLPQLKTHVFHVSMETSCWFSPAFLICWPKYSPTYCSFIPRAPPLVYSFSLGIPPVPSSSPGRARLKLGLRPLKVAKRVNWLTTLVDWFWNRELYYLYNPIEFIGGLLWHIIAHIRETYQPTSIMRVSMDPSWSSWWYPGTKLDGIETHKICQFG